MRWIPFVNLILVACIGIALVGVVFSFAKTPQAMVEAPVSIEKQLPKRPFEVAQLVTLHQGPLELKWVEPTLELPQLSNQLLFHGLNLRPDAVGPNPRFYLSFQGSEKIHCVQSSQPIYLSYCDDAKETAVTQGPIWGPTAHEVSYTLSSDPTSLWLEMVPRQNGKLLDVTVHMKDELGQEIAAPARHRHFTLNHTEPDIQKGQWELDDLRVDSTLLIRQKARWSGSDLFLSQHGGEEFDYVSGRQRIDFGTGEERYSCFVKAGDYLTWKEGRWQEAHRCEQETCNDPLLAVKKIDDKVMSFELWDNNGISKIPLNLIKSRDVTGMPNLAEEFRFIGAKTWAQFIVEARSHRLTLKPHDWLVLTAEGWSKLDTSEKIDAFVSGKVSGPLLVLNKLSKLNGKQVLTGYLYNATRSEVDTVEIPTVVNTYSTPVTETVSTTPQPITHGGVE